MGLETRGQGTQASRLDQGGIEAPKLAPGPSWERLAQTSAAPRRAGSPAGPRPWAPGQTGSPAPGCARCPGSRQPRSGRAAPPRPARHWAAARGAAHDPRVGAVVFQLLGFRCVSDRGPVLASRHHGEQVRRRTLVAVEARRGSRGRDQAAVGPAQAQRTRAVAGSFVGAHEHMTPDGIGHRERDDRPAGRPQGLEQDPIDRLRDPRPRQEGRTATNDRTRPSNVRAPVRKRRGTTATNPTGSSPSRAATPSGAGTPGEANCQARYSDV
jgi:hypothetical protein